MFYLHKKSFLSAPFQNPASRSPLLLPYPNIPSVISAFSLQNVIDKSESNIEIDGIFVAIGQIPSNIASEVERDDYGYIIANEDMKTNIEGVFVAGDVRSKKVRQVITAASDGAIAAEMANEYILNKYEIK